MWDNVTSDDYRVFWVVLTTFHFNTEIIDLLEFIPLCKNEMMEGERVIRKDREEKRNGQKRREKEVRRKKRRREEW